MHEGGSFLDLVIWRFVDLIWRLADTPLEAEESIRGLLVSYLEDLQARGGGENQSRTHILSPHAPQLRGTACLPLEQGRAPDH